MNTGVDEQKFVAIVLAGDRSNADPVAAHSGTSCKAVADIYGKPMVTRVLDALQASGRVKSIILCGPAQTGLDECPELLNRIETDGIQWLRNSESPSRSVETALELVDESEPVFLTTADHALLSADIVRYFLSEALDNQVDFNVGLVDYSTVQSAYPEVKRTVIKLKEKGVCGCNLFAIMTLEGRKLVSFWRNVEQSRKKPAKMLAGVLGVGGVLSYLLHRLTIEGALEKVSSRLGVKVKPVILPFARAGIDVDTVKDKLLIEKILANDSVTVSSEKPAN
ncbi:MAG: NTP transferase domain-containing protein [Gammaproteobacteria bacterium]|nr:NTP transferase domain-containing protein [Gammaproteobacteria bacterium]